MSREASSVCRICSSGCGVRVTIGDDGKVHSVRNDRKHPLTAGHVCFKGLQSGETHNSPNRIITTQKRMPDGGFRSVKAEDALDEIAEKLLRLKEQFGPEAIATYMGGPSFFYAPVPPMLAAFRQAVGTTGDYSSITIDQPGKVVAAERLGFWSAGKTPLAESDVMLLVGTNPLVSFQCIGALTVDPVKSLKRAKARGMKLIVIDPRRTETAEAADVFLQSIPGEDVTVLAGLINAILVREGQDQQFCDQYVRPGHLDRLRKAVAPFTSDYVAHRGGVDPAALAAAAELFSTKGFRGSAFSGTGTSMGAKGSLAEHMLEILNVICGRFPRQGDSVRDVTPWLPYRERHAQVIGPLRSWEKLPPARIRGVPLLYGQKLTCNLADEITTPGNGQIHALINDAGNIASAVPDQRKVVNALKQLDLLVSIEPFFTTTAKLSHYVFAPKLQFERPDLPISYPGQSFQPIPWGQYLPQLAVPPEGSELVDEWYVFWALAKRMGLALDFCGVPLAFDRPPTTDELIAYQTRDAVVALNEIKKYPDGGHVFHDIAQTVQGPTEGAGMFEPMPDDVQSELAAVRAEGFGEVSVDSQSSKRFTHRLAVRRSRHLINSQGLYTQSVRSFAPFNPACLNPVDMRAMGLTDGQRVMLISQRDRIEARVQADDTVRTGVVTMSHGWGSLPGEDDYEGEGSCTNRLLDGDNDLDPYSAVAVMTGIPVQIEPIAQHAVATMPAATRQRVPA